ncbi:MAG: hypothetical protein RLZZ436_1442, partial [Planctomycetota bacterium]
ASTLYPQAAAKRLIALSLLTSHFSLLTSHFSLLTSHFSLLTSHFSLPSPLSALHSRAASRPAAHHESPPCFSPEGDTSGAAPSAAAPHRVNLVDTVDSRWPSRAPERTGGSPRLRFAPWCVPLPAAAAARCQHTLPAGSRPAAHVSRKPRVAFRRPRAHAARGVSSAVPALFTRGLPPCGSCAFSLLTSHFLTLSTLASALYPRASARRLMRWPPGGSRVCHLRPLSPIPTAGSFPKTPQLQSSQSRIRNQQQRRQAQQPWSERSRTDGLLQGRLEHLLRRRAA